MNPKQLIQDFVGRFGYELHRKEKAFEPFVEDLAIGGVQFRFWVGHPIGLEWYNPEGHARVAEPKETARLLCLGDRVLDIGAHHGFEMMLFSKLVGPQGFVLGVEPFPFNAMLANAQIGLNGASNCHILQAAVGSENGTVTISRESNARVLPHGLTVPVHTADELDTLYGPFTAIKIDVEGFEHEVLKGASSLLSRGPKLLLEVHPQLLPLYGSSVPELVAMLPGYEGTFVPRGDDWVTVHAYAPERVPHDVSVNLFVSRSPASQR